MKRSTNIDDGDFCENKFVKSVRRDCTPKHCSRLILSTHDCNAKNERWVAAVTVTSCRPAVAASPPSLMQINQFYTFRFMVIPASVPSRRQREQPLVSVQCLVQVSPDSRGSVHCSVRRADALEAFISRVVTVIDKSEGNLITLCC